MVIKAWLESSEFSMREDRERFINRTREFWQSRSAGTISREDARQIIQNISGFFEILANWQTTITTDNPYTYLHTEQDAIKKRVANE